MYTVSTLYLHSIYTGSSEDIYSDTIYSSEGIQSREYPPVPGCIYIYTVSAVLYSTTTKVPLLRCSAAPV